MPILPFLFCLFKSRKILDYTIVGEGGIFKERQGSGVTINVGLR
jgi:hypothetical protein